LAQPPPGIYSRLLLERVGVFRLKDVQRRTCEPCRNTTLFARIQNACC
jgi:hypothetical protein